MVPPLQIGIGIGMARPGVAGLAITGVPISGNLLKVQNPDHVYLLMDNGERLLDDGEQLAYGAEEGAYQWYINDDPVQGATDIYFTVPDWVIAGDLVRVNASAPVMVQATPFAVLSAAYAQVNQFIVSDEEPELLTVNDREVSRTPLSQVASDFEFRETVRGTVTGDAWSFVSSNPAVATVHPTTGYVSYVSAGSVVITASIRDYSVDLPLNLVTFEGENSDEFVSYEIGSAAKDASDAVDARIAAKHDPAVNMRIFTTQNHTGQIYVRNPDLWCNDLDLTCISPWNSNGGATKAGTLISPRHIVFASHYEIAVGATVRFVAADGTVVNRVMTAKARHPDYVPYYPDITIGLLDSDVPGSIGFAKVLPDDWADYFPSIAGQDARIPTIGIDQEEKATIQDWLAHNNSVSNIRPTDLNRLALYENKITGDSGNPCFVVIGEELVILTVWTTGVAGAGTAIANQKTAINAMMTSLGGGYQLTDCDLSSYNSYP